MCLTVGSCIVALQIMIRVTIIAACSVLLLMARRCNCWFSISAFAAAPSSTTGTSVLISAFSYRCVYTFVVPL